MSVNFINRTKEINWLNNRYLEAKKEGQLLIIYGKRRVGKTELIKQFAKNKHFVYHVAEKGTAKAQLQAATKAFAEGFKDQAVAKTSFPSWRELFSYVSGKLKNVKKPVILVVDEFPYLVASDKGISSYFQVGWDEFLKNKKVVFVLMGSSISMMYKHTLVKSAPLYGRRTGQWRLEPFSYADSKNFYPGSTFGKTFPLYAISGGIPAYAKIFDGKIVFKKNLEKFVFPEGSYLSSEPELLLSDEFEDSRSYLTILKAIGLGRTKFSEIAQESLIPATALPGYLKTLINLRLVTKEVPVTDPIPEKSKKGWYSLSDPYLRFYFSFVYPNISLIKSGNYKMLFDQYGQVLTNLIAKSYEDTTAEFIQKIIDSGSLPLFEKMGRWWDKNTEIDLVGLNQHDNTILFVETKWNAKPIGTRVLKHLKESATKLKWGSLGRKEYFALVAKGGFTKKLKKIATEEGVVLIHKDKHPV